MKKEDQTPLNELSQEELTRVHGAGIQPVTPGVPQAQDMYGNTMSIEEWMDRNIAMLYDSSIDPHDFYDKYYDRDKPNIWH